MLTKACKKCGATVTFNTGVGAALGGQPLRHHSECPACGAGHWVMADDHDIYGMYEPEEPAGL